MIETRDTNYCPECHRLELEKIAARMVVREKPKKENASGVKEEAKKKVEKKALRKPIEKPSGTVPVVKETKPMESVPEKSLEADMFWGDLEGGRRRARRSAKEHPQAAIVGETPMKAPPVIPESEKRRAVPVDMREKAVLTAEGFPTTQPFEGVEARRKHAPRKKRRIPGEGIVSMQMPDEYDGEITPEPSYLKSVLYGALAGALCSGAYAGIAWWTHKEYGITGWALGIVVGVAVVLGSGRHFNFVLGGIALGLSMIFVSAGRILMYMLTVWFPAIRIINIPTIENFKNALETFVHEFPTKDWLIVFSIAAAVAFLISFRPWPIRVQAPPQPVRPR